MTLTMADSITPVSLPFGYNAYLGYVDGEWATAAALRQRFPGVRILTLTVLGGNAVADGCDRETGDLTPESAAAWVHGRLAAGAVRPVVYASASAMAEVLEALAAAGVTRSEVRLLSAHYDAGQHICGPATCGQVAATMDGTQWTDEAPGIGGTRIDASLLADDFFDVAPTPPSTAKTPPSTANWQEALMAALPEVQHGATGEAVRTVQGLLVARGHVVAVDGSFGPATHAAVIELQAAARIAQDGVVGPDTYKALLGVA